MRKENLKYGNVVETGSGDKYLYTYHDEEDIFVDLTGDGYYYYESLYINTSGINSDIFIIKVYKDYTCKELLWERKETPKLTEDEKVILRNLSKEYKYIARDKSDWIFLYKNEPLRFSTSWSGCMYTSLPFKHLFQFIKWEDEEPYLIEDLLKGENND